MDDGDVFGLARACRHDGAPAFGPGGGQRLGGLGQGADLVRLDQRGVAGGGGGGGTDAGGVGGDQVVADDLHAVRRRLREGGDAGRVVLRQRILDQIGRAHV